MNFGQIFEESSEIKIKDQQLGKKLQVNILKPVKTKYGDSFLLFNKKYNKHFFANSQLKGYLNKLLPDLKVSDGYYYKDDDMSPIVEFIITAVGERVQLQFIKSKQELKSEVLELSSDEEVDSIMIKKLKK